MKKPIAVLGLQWGDEGKGKFTDYLGGKFDVTVRYNGGNNAGHTVKVKDRTLHLSLIPSTVLHGKKVLIGQAVVINPKVLLDEIEKIESLGVKPDIGLDPRCHIVMPYHQLMDAASEIYKGAKSTGSLKLGIGFTYADRTNRAGVRLEDLVDPARLRQRLEDVWDLKRLQITKAYGAPFNLNLNEVVKTFTAFGKRLKPYMLPVPEFIMSASPTPSVLFESAQGFWLDFAFGSYPYTVAYSTVSSSALTDTGLPPQSIKVLGLVKAYTTRVGNGPFPAELSDSVGEHLRSVGHEFGTVSGRPRRCGWLDLPMVKKACQVNGVTSIALTKTDVLSGLKSIKVVSHYRINGQVTDTAPTLSKEWETAKPVYHELKGWSQDLSHIRVYSQLPLAVKEYVSYIESRLNTPIQYVSVGPDRSQTIKK